MTLPFYHGLRTSRQSLPYHPDAHDPLDTLARAQTRKVTGFYAATFMDDVILTILPVPTGVPTHLGRQPYRVSLSPSDTQAQRLVIDAIGNNNQDEELAEAASSFFGDCARNMMAFGEAPYEIVYFSPPGDEKTVAFKLAFIHPWTLSRRWGKVVQRIPADVARSQGIPHQAQLAADNIVTFSLPRKARGDVKQFVADLSFLDTHLRGLPASARPRVGGPAKEHQVTFDIDEHRFAERLALAAAGKDIGWDARGEFQEDMLEYYEMHRLLHFEGFKIELRDSILQTLNAILERAGRMIGFSGRIVVEGMPNIKTVAAAQEELANGSEYFPRIVARFTEI